jgi:hypothetical protein
MTSRIPKIVLGLALLTLGCWMLMFAAVHDVWHDMGRPDVLTRLSEHGATTFDMRGAIYSFYGLLPLLVAQVLVAGAAVLRRR